MELKLSFVVLILYYVASPSMGQVGSSIGSDAVRVPKEDLKNLEGKEKANLKDQSTSLMTRPGQPVGLASRLSQLEAEFRGKLEDIKAQTSRSIKDHDDKIAKVMGWEHKLAQLLNQSMEMVKELKTQNRDQSKRIDQLEKKVATLLQNTPPASSALIRGNNNEKMKNRALTPPSSCQDLAMLDYYLDGLYLVKNKQTKKIQTVFCKFSDDNKVSQDLIGHVDVKTSTAHFYVQRKSSFGSNAVVPFELTRLNEGNAFNLKSGIFTVPVSGIYHFEFSGVKLNYASHLSIFLQVNGVNVGLANTKGGANDVATLSASLRLVAGDRVNLFNAPDSVLFGNGKDDYTHFSGWLLDEILM